MPKSATRRSIVVTVALALVVVAGVGLIGVQVWDRTHRTPLEDALDRLPASSLRVAFTDWSVVREAVKADLGQNPSDADIEEFMSSVYDDDFSAASSIDESAVALQENYGFSPANAQWEAFAQGRKGATMVLKVADGTDFGILADNLDTIGYRKPKQEDGVWVGGVDVVAELDATISPELQQVVLLENEGLVVTSDSREYAVAAAEVAAGDADGLASTGNVDGLAEPLERAANAYLWADDFACEDLAMSRADPEAEAEGKTLVEQAGGVTPLKGLAMGMTRDRTLRVVERFADDDDARRNLRPRARLAVGDAVGRGEGRFSEQYRLTRSRTAGPTVVLDLEPRQDPGYVLSAVYDGPVIFATC